MTKSRQITQLELASSLPPTSQLQLEIPTQFLDRNFKITLQNIIDFITKDTIGLGNVDNTSDAEKELSTKAIEALLTKADKDHKHDVEDINNFYQALADYVQSDANIPLERISGLIEILQGKASSEHKHEIADVNGLQETLNNKASVSHSHNLTELDGFQVFMETISNAVNSKVSQNTFDTTVESLRQQISQMTVNAGIVEIMPNEW